MQTVCIKIGGSLMDRAAFFNEFARSVAALRPERFPVIVHGGGKEISRQLDLLGRPVQFVEGMRVTDAESVDVVQMVLSGSVNKRLVNALQTIGTDAVGVSGVDCGLLLAERLLVNGRDIGFVGSIKSVRRDLLDWCAHQGIVPVVSPISRDEEGNIYNVNADVAAAEIAVALRADHLVFVSDVRGVMIDNAVMHELRTDRVEGHIASGAISGGMAPKVRSAVAAVRAGVGQVHICGWNGEKTILNELDKATRSGTVILE